MYWDHAVDKNKYKVILYSPWSQIIRRGSVSLTTIFKPVAYFYTKKQQEQKRICYDKIIVCLNEPVNDRMKLNYKQTASELMKAFNNLFLYLIVMRNN